MNLRDYHILEHIFDHCCSIEEALQRCGQSYEALSSDDILQSAIAFHILQIGELATHLSEEFRSASASQIPWHQIRGLRNRIVHNYDHIDKDVIWSSAVNDVPGLKAFCEGELHSNRGMLP